MDYLQTIGILQWRLRGEKPVIFYRYEFYAEGQTQPIGLMLADARLCNEAEQQLVEAIAKAVKKKFIGKPVTELNLASLAHTGVIILLGKTVAALATEKLAGHQQIISYSPAELLANPNLKAKTWEQIKKAMQMMPSG